MLGTRVQAGAVALQVCDYGGDGSPVIFLHFGGGNLMMWEDAVSFFAGRHRPVLMDLRGHGKSDRPPTGYDIDTMAGDVVHAMTSLGVDRAHIVGSSLGAEVALAMAVRYPERVLSIVCDGANSSEYGPYSQ
jgi:2-succinyl-6-hydroxy-2,4-cyclohexadiene-1-carboxylate synthase